MTTGEPDWNALNTARDADRLIRANKV